MVDIKKLFFVVFVSFSLQLVYGQKVFMCYWPNWYGQSTYSSLNPSLCTHITYAYGTPNNQNGEIGDLPMISEFSKMKTDNPTLKLIVSLGGWKYGDGFKPLAASPSLRTAFATNILKLLVKNKLDGVEIDWEYPDNATNFVLLLQEIHNKLNPKGLKIFITVSASIDESSIKSRYDILNITKYVDFINLMTYDYHGTWDNWGAGVAHNAPLFAKEGDLLSVDKTVQYWISTGIGSTKLLLGIPFYGNRYTLSSSSNTNIGARGSGGLTIPYNEICKTIKNYTTVFDDLVKAPYAFKGYDWIGYDNKRSIQLKMDYMNKNNLTGAFIWEMTQDDLSGACGDGKLPLTTLIRNAVSTGPHIQPSGVVGPPNAPSPSPALPPSPAHTPSSDNDGVISKCTSQGMFPFKSDCTKYNNCVHIGFPAYVMDCAPTTFWNQALQTCDYVCGQ